MYKASRSNVLIVICDTLFGSQLYNVHLNKFNSKSLFRTVKSISIFEVSSPRSLNLNKCTFTEK